MVRARNVSCCLAASILLVVSSIGLAGEPIAIESLLAEMVERETVARLPATPYTCRQSSSYDRRSVDPEDASTWFANADSNNWVRIENVTVAGKQQRQYVLFDQQGPGVIVRIWSTWGPTGEDFANDVLRIYIDGNEEPAVEGRLSEVLDSGILAGAPLAQGVSPDTPFMRRGHNLYLPIPYAKSCKVALVTQVPVEDEANTSELYYQINYRTYPAGTQVESFSLDRLKAAKPAVDKVQALLTVPTPDTKGSQHASIAPARLAPGEAQTLEISGSKAIRQLRVGLKADDLEQALRSTVLEIEFDGEPSVWVPVGEFFGTSYYPTEFRTWYTSSDGAGQFSCDWVMPFEKTAKISLRNLGAQEVELQTLTAAIADWKWDERSMHFNARWHELFEASTSRPTPGNEKGAYDVNYVTIEGEGVYVGDTLTILNTRLEIDPNVIDSDWWGEGDEKIFVDGEKFPSHFGTGTEDYYGYAWCKPAAFVAPFHALPVGKGGPTKGLWVHSRYRTLDAIPFNSSLKLDMEMWHNSKAVVNYAPTTIYYARPGSKCNIAPDPKAAARAIPRS